MKLKLFVWDDVLYDYTGGIAFATARNVEEARAMLLAELGEHSSHRRDFDEEPCVFDLIGRNAAPMTRLVHGGG